MPATLTRPPGSLRRVPTVSRSFPGDGAVRAQLAVPRVGLVTERAGDTPGDFVQESGPFAHYRRTLRNEPGHVVVETTDYRLRIPWFGWLFALPVRSYLRRGATRPATGKQPWWAPPDQLDPRQVAVLGLLAAAAMASAFTNTLFTQTATFAADSFGVGDSGVGWGGALVRAGIVIAIPLGSRADRWGRRRVIRWVAWSAPVVCALGALAPNFPVLVATQTLGRPLGLTLDLLIAVVAVEEMPRNSRAYAISVMAMASGLGAGIAVMALPLADLGDDGWRLVYVVTLAWLTVAVSLTRHLPETVRFERPHKVAPPLDRRRMAMLAGALVCGNLFVAPASFFQNRYLNDVRGLSATMVAVFTLCTATPAALGLVAGGRFADMRGRRRLIAVALPLATLGILTSFFVSGAPMWLTAFGGGLLGGVVYPALAVYRAELFPTGNRGRANALLMTAALGGGVGGILLVGQLTDGGRSYGQALALTALGQLVVVALVLTRFPETAHRELEDLNPEDVTNGGSRRSP
jgi:MFS family permease